MGQPNLFRPSATLSERQRDYISSFGKGLIAVLHSQLALCSEKKISEDVTSLIIKPEYLLTALHLETDIPDGLSLLERFLLASDNQIDVGASALQVLRTVTKMQKLLEKEIIEPYVSGKFNPNEAQEHVLKNIALIFDRQISREGNGCLIAQEFAIKFVKYRPEYLSTTTIEYLKINSIPISEKDMALFLGNDYDFEDIFQLMLLHLRVGTFEYEMNQTPPLQQPTKGGLQASFEFWKKLTEEYRVYMDTKAGKNHVEPHQADVFEHQIDTITASALRLHQFLDTQD